MRVESASSVLGTLNGSGAGHRLAMQYEEKKKTIREYKLTLRVSWFRRVDEFNSCDEAISVYFLSRTETLTSSLCTYLISFAFSFESFLLQPILHHFFSSSIFTFNRPGDSFDCVVDVGSTVGTLGTSVTPPRGPQATPSNAVQDFLFLTITISPMSGSMVGYT